MVDQARHSVPMRLWLSLNDNFVQILSRKNPSFAVLLAQHDRDTQDLSYLLSQSCCDTLVNVPCSDGNTHCATISCILHITGVYSNLLMMSCVILMIPWLDKRSSSGANVGSSGFRVGRGTSGKTSLKTPEGAHGEPLIASKSSVVVTSGINFTARDLIHEPISTTCDTVFFSVNVFPAMRQGAIFPSSHHLELSQTILNITAAPNGRSSHDVVFSSISHKQICRHSPHDTCSEDLLRARRSKETQVSGPRWDLHSGRKVQKNHSRHLLN